VTLPPVGLVQACEDPRLLGGAFTLWPGQRRVLEAIENPPRMHVLALGRRSGKTMMMALAGLWCCLLRPELLERLRPGERGYAVCIATNQRQARLVLDAARTIVEHSPLLAGLVESDEVDQLTFANGTGFAAFPCTARGVRGWPVFALLFDELAHFVSETEGPAVADRVLEALLPATAQFGNQARVIASSTPWGSDGCFAEHFTRARSGELADARAHHATTAEMNPTIDPAFLAQEEARDPESFKSEYLAQFVGSGGAFFDYENVAAAVTLPGELRPEDGVGWVAGLDPAFSQDKFAICLVGRDPVDLGRLLVGLVRGLRPARRKAASLEESREIEDSVLAEVAQVIRLFNARAVTDQYKSAGVVERLRRYGIAVHAEAMTAPVKDSAFGFLRGRINDGSIELYEHPDLLRELRAIRTQYAGKRSSVVLPRIAGGHCDHAQALAIACLEHDRHGLGRSGELPPLREPSSRTRAIATEEALAAAFGERHDPTRKPRWEDQFESTDIIRKVF